MLQQVFSCCKLKVFYLDAAYVAVAIQVCCNYIFNVLAISNVCCKCFIWILYML
jgi:hypothetical protein